MNADPLADVREFIRIEILDDPGAELAPEEDLILNGILDSLSIMRLVAYLEGQLPHREREIDTQKQRLGIVRTSA